MSRCFILVFLPHFNTNSSDYYLAKHIWWLWSKNVFIQFIFIDQRVNSQVRSAEIPTNFVVASVVMYTKKWMLYIPHALSRYNRTQWQQPIAYQACNYIFRTWSICMYCRHSNTAISSFSVYFFKTTWKRTNYQFLMLVLLTFFYYELAEHVPSVCYYA